MADGIEVPVTPPTKTVATRERDFGGDLGVAHAQITEQNRVTVSAVVGISGEFALSTVYDVTGDDWLVMSDGASIDLAPGIWNVLELRCIASAGSPMADGMVVALTPFVAADPATWPSDSDVFAGTFAGGTGLESLFTQYIGDFTPIIGTNRRMVAAGAERIVTVLTGGDSLRLTPFTTVDQAFDTGELLIVFMTLERIGEATTA